MKRVLVLAALLSAPVFAYNEAVHAFLTRHALPDETPVVPPTQKDLDAFRNLFWRRASAHPAFAQRFPSPESFTSWEFKQFLMLDPAARVHGLDANYVTIGDRSGSVVAVAVETGRGVYLVAFRAPTAAGAEGLFSKLIGTFDPR